MLSVIVKIVAEVNNVWMYHYLLHLTLSCSSSRRFLSASSFSLCSSSSRLLLSPSSSCSLRFACCFFHSISSRDFSVSSSLKRTKEYHENQIKEMRSFCQSLSYLSWRSFRCLFTASHLWDSAFDVFSTPLMSALSRWPPSTRTWLSANRDSTVGSQAFTSLMAFW